MSRVLRSILIFLVSLVLIIALAAAVLGPLTVRRSFPQTDGELKIAGLQAQVEVYRDSFGVPQIYAANSHDLFFAQGYVHAQDRFWQMDFWRHIGSARLSEMFGESQVDTDKFLRELGWARVAQKELETLDPNSLAILDAYTAGVNAYLADHQGSALSLEYAVLKLLNPDYKPEPWQPLNTLTWAKAMAWDLGGNMSDEMERAKLLKTLTAEQVASLYPPYPANHPLVVTDAELGSHGAFDPLKPAGTAQTSQPALLSPGLPAGAAGSLPAEMRKPLDALNALLGPAAAGIGSNNWVISGKLTSTGKPFLANDPHLAAQMPSIWYEIGLHCLQKTADCPYEVTGFSFAGAPGVIIGHNDQIAWGMTNVGPDVQDLYIEKINPDNPNQYEVNGKWVDMQLVNETIQVAGGKPVELVVRYTRHGPIIYDDQKTMDEFRVNVGIELPKENFRLALRWTALEPNYLFRSIWMIDRAQNWEDFRAGAAEFAAPSQNLVYADVDGNIGYQMPGNVPIRAKGDGSMPVPGWTDSFEWTGYIPFEQLPYTFNPPKGYIVTANNAVVGTDYRYMISLDWDRGYRAQRIVDMIKNAPGPIDSAYIQKMQGDDMNLNAEQLVPVLLQVPLNDSHLEQARKILQGWDFEQTIDSAPAALFEAFWKHLLSDTFWDQLPQDSRPEGGERWYEVVRNCLPEDQGCWWDDISTPEIEGRDQIFQRAFGEAVKELEASSGKDPAGWHWGKLHTITFSNQTLGGESSPAPIRALFNRGPFETAGGSDIVNATAWAANLDYTVQWLPSMRMIVDLNALSNSLSIHTTGESGHAYNKHYIDMADYWRKIEYHPMLWDRTQIESAPDGVLKLAP